jgi:hypothetical protein
MNELIERLEKATGPDRDLDYDIANHISLDADTDAPPYTGSIDAALTLLPPGFWWRGGTCCVSSEATVCPDHNDPEHRERLLAECPPVIEHWNSGIEVELRPGSPGALVRALAAACLRARAALPSTASTP